MKFSINSKLLELYKSYWDKYSFELKKILSNDDFPYKPTNPLLLSYSNNEHFESTDIRIMIIGKQTNDWESYFYDDMEKILSVYRDFYRGDFFLHRGFFNNHFNIFLQLIKQNYPHKKISCFWNNIIKTGIAGADGTPPSYITDIEKKYFLLLEHEIEIIKPNIILFFTGSNYDTFLKDQLPKIHLQELTGFKHEDLLFLKIKNVDIAFRTLSPVVLHYSGKSYYENIYSKIISEIANYV